MKIVKSAANSSIPKFKKNNRIINFPPEIMELYRTKNKCQKQYKKTKSLTDKENLDAIKSILAHELDELRSKNWNNFNKNLGKNILSAAPFWKRISRLKNNQVSGRISSLIVNGIEFTTDQEKFNIFADKLEKKFSNEENQNFNQGNLEKIRVIQASPKLLYSF